MVTVTINGRKEEYESGITYEQIAFAHQEEYEHRIVLAVSNGKIKELHKEIEKDCEVSFLTLHDRFGHDTYVRSSIMLLVKAVSDVVGSPGQGRLKVEFTVGDGFYCSAQGNFTIGEDFLKRVRKRMCELRDADLPITKSAYPTGEAIEIFERQGMQDKVNLFKYRRGSYINVYCMDGYYDYYYGYMVPRTGYLQYFDLIPYKDGCLLMLPDESRPEVIRPFEPREKLFATLRYAEDWGDKMGINTVADLNDKICEGNLADLILVQEALQERRIGEIAGDIAKREGVKFIMIAGPSSSGKTTFSHRLSIQLKTHGLTPHPIGVDDYFVNRENTPRDENGEYNFECLEAIDVERFNQDMCDLLAGKTVEMPRFNFKTGRREYRGETLTLGSEDILVIEGIHGLNDALSHSLPLESKYKIYISALTSLNVDGHNRISTTDGRLLRRMVRDSRTRGASAVQTLRMWPSVRRGEEENIFPFQESADAMFNSVLIYELAVLKQYAEPLLYKIGKEEPDRKSVV